MQICYKKGFRYLTSSYGFFFDCQCFLEDLSMFLLQIFSFLTVSLSSSKEQVAAHWVCLSDNCPCVLPDWQGLCPSQFPEQCVTSVPLLFPKWGGSRVGAGSFKGLSSSGVFCSSHSWWTAANVSANVSAFCFHFDGCPLHSAHETRVRPLGKIPEDFTWAVELCWPLHGSLLQKVNELEIHLTHIPSKDLK